MKAEADKMLRKKEQAAEEKIAAQGGLGAVMKRKSMKPERFYGEAAEEPEGEEEEEPERRMVKKQKVEADPDSTAEVCVSAERCPVLAIPFQSKHALTPPGSQSSSVTVVFSVGPKEVQLTLDASAVVAGACSPLSSCFNSSMLSPWVALQGRRTATSA